MRTSIGAFLLLLGCSHSSGNVSLADSGNPMVGSDSGPDTLVKSDSNGPVAVGSGVSGAGQVGGGTKGGTGTPVSPAGESSYWIQNTSQKVQPTTVPPRMGGPAAIEGARGSVESFQIVLRGSLSVADVVSTDLSDGAGNVIPASLIQLFREDYIDFSKVTSGSGTLPVPANSPTKDGRIPDPLVPVHDPYTGKQVGLPLKVADGTNQPIWVDVRIPISQPYGTYTGSISFAGTEIKVPLSLTVWNITIPDMRSVPAWFQMAYEYIGAYHAGVDDCYSTRCTAESREIIRRYQELVHEHRCDPRQTLLPDLGACPVPSASDWSQLDAALGPYMDGSYFDDGVPSSLVAASYSPHGSDWGPPGCSQSEMTASAKAVGAHMKEKGWFDRTYVFAEDEPPGSDIAAIAQQASWLVQGDPDWYSRIFDTVVATTETTKLLDPYMRTFVVCLSCFDKWRYQPGYGGDDVLGRADWVVRIAQGKQFWLYESNAQGAPYPGFSSNTLDAAEPRMVMWASWFERASGFLYWNISAWDSKDPWGPNTRYEKAGDGVLIYPGDHSGTNTGKGSPQGIAIQGPIPSLRLKMIRSGFQDWALFLLAEKQGLRDRVMKEMGSVYSQLGGCTWDGCPKPPNGSWFWRTDYDLMSAVRRNVVDAMLTSK